MDIKELMAKAKKLAGEQQARREEPFYRHTIAWFCYLGLLRHNKILAHRHTVSLEDALKAGELEPRVLELIPAILIVMPQALSFHKSEIPKDLAVVLRDIRARKIPQAFRGILPHVYLHWLRAPVMEIAKRRLDFHRLPRRRANKTHSIGEVIRTGRRGLALTQEQLAKKHKLSLRVIRDLEQGKLDASLKATNAILAVFGKSLSV